ncbi:MAG: hypothetical protein LUD68_04435 [Rikenellaceae bacterium]|nr:hypothetical protein [Rikenellaceae bacterium]
MTADKIDPCWYNKLEFENNRKPAKVYRRTFSHQGKIYRAAGEYILEDLNHPFLKDVTAEFVRTAELICRPFKNNSVNKNIYLCAFCNLEWLPVARQRISKEIRFEQVAVNHVYCLGMFTGEELEQIGDPFIFDAHGRTIPLTPSAQEFQTVALTRKYPFTSHYLRRSTELVGISGEGSMSPDFTGAEPLFVCDSVSHYEYYHARVCGTYRYLKFKSIHQTVAEIFLMDEGNRPIDILPTDPDQPLHPLFDKDPLTYGSIGDSLIVDLQQPRSLKDIYIFARNDGNNLFPDQEYELFVNRGGRWISYGKKETADFELEFAQIPAGALYWLRNRQKGVQERIFTYEDGKITWW